jgi:hypothetical protein
VDLEDHKVLFDCRLLAKDLESVGFDVTLLERGNEDRIIQSRR